MHEDSAWGLVPGAWCRVPSAECLVPGAECLTIVSLYKLASPIMILVVLLLLLGGPAAYAQRAAPITGADPSEDVIDHGRFDSLWRASKRFGRIDTRGVSTECYTSYRAALAGATPQRYLPESQTAFWVNAYLACLMETMHLRTGYRSTLWDSLYDKRDTFSIAGEPHTLRSLGEKIIAVAGTVRARAFLATGSTNEPPFPAHACFAHTVRRELREQVRKVCRNDRYLLFDPAGKTLQLARMFEAWQPHMELEGGSVVDFLLPWVTEALAAQLALAGPDLRIVYSDRIERWRRQR